MNDLKLIDSGLVPVYETSTGDKVVYGSELCDTLAVKSNYREWVSRRFSDVDAIENEDFQGVEISTPSGQARKDHIIRLDIAKEMAMLERNDTGKQVRKYFIDVEKRFKSAVVDRSSLSPQMQLFYSLADSMARTELEQKRQAEKIDAIEQKQNAITDALEPIHKDTWRKDITMKFNRIQRKSGIPFDELRIDTYKELDRRAGVDTARRWQNRRTRMRVNGESETNIRRLTRMDVIESDRKLKLIYEKILEDYEIRYSDPQYI